MQVTPRLQVYTVVTGHCGGVSAPSVEAEQAAAGWYG